MFLVVLIASILSIKPTFTHIFSYLVSKTIHAIVKVKHTTCTVFCNFIHNPIILYFLQ